MGATSCGWTERGCVTFPGYRGSQRACYVSTVVPGLSVGLTVGVGQGWSSPRCLSAEEPHRRESVLRGPLPWHEGLLEGRLVDSCLRAHLLASAQFPLLCFRHVHRTSQVQDIGERFKLAFLLIKMKACIHFRWMCDSWVERSCWVS